MASSIAKRLVLTAVFILIAILVSPIVYVFVETGLENWSSRRVEESQAIGDRIIAALQAYQRDHGNFPETLRELTPTYLSEIDPPTAGTREWSFSQQNSRLYLAFSAKGGYPICFYGSGYGQWYVDQ